VSTKARSLIFLCGQNGSLCLLLRRLNPVSRPPSRPADKRFRRCCRPLRGASNTHGKEQGAREFIAEPLFQPPVLFADARVKPHRYLTVPVQIYFSFLF